MKNNNFIIIQINPQIIERFECKPINVAHLLTAASQQTDRKTPPITSPNRRPLFYDHKSSHQIISCNLLLSKTSRSHTLHHTLIYLMSFIALESFMGKKEEQMKMYLS